MPEKRIIHIPLPGGSGRVPTGAIQFLDDWPGLFLRGDSAVHLMVHIRALMERLAKHEDGTVGALLYPLGQLADLIERDVVVKR